MSGSGQDAFGRQRWRCRCDCGKTVVRGDQTLAMSRTPSCGCARVRHGHTRRGERTPEYWTWESMRARCERSDHKSYAAYGGRGIRVCRRWRSFENFLADMGRRPRGTTLERIDRSRGYAPGNCRWATAIEQHNNESRNRRLTVRGLTLTVTEWSRRTGVNRSTIGARLKAGWTPEQAIRPSAVRRW